jgi:hypothetical protein
MRLPEQVGMAAGAGKDKVVAVDLVEKQPVTAELASLDRRSH